MLEQAKTGFRHKLSVWTSPAELLSLWVYTLCWCLHDPVCLLRPHTQGNLQPADWGLRNWHPCKINCQFKLQTFNHNITIISSILRQKEWEKTRQLLYLFMFKLLCNKTNVYGLWWLKAWANVSADERNSPYRIMGFFRPAIPCLKQDSHHSTNALTIISSSKGPNRSPIFGQRYGVWAATGNLSNVANVFDKSWDVTAVAVTVTLWEKAEEAICRILRFRPCP